MFPIVALLLVPQQSSGRPNESTGASLEVSFELDPAVISLDDAFLLRQAIKNVGDRPIYVGFFVDTWRVRDLDSNESFSWRGVKRQPEEKPRREHLFRLDPGHTLGSVLGAPIPVRLLVTKPGRYEMTQTSRSRVDWKEHAGVRVWNTEDETLVASFKFRVVE
jgi:hypothetical protein